MLNIKIPILISILIFLYPGCREQKNALTLQSGDIIFQKSLEPQHLVMDFLDMGKYNHCGIIVKKSGKYFVLSSEKTVSYTELKKWVQKGEGQHYRVLRPEKNLQKKMNLILAKAGFFQGRTYDFKFDWDDRKLYNSELVQKVYYNGARVMLGEFIRVTGISVLPSDSTVYQSCKDFIPYDKEVVTVQSIFNSPHLKLLMLKN